MAKAVTRLRILLAAFLAVVLTLGPCLSIYGLSGSGEAHAYALLGHAHSSSAHNHGVKNSHHPTKNDKQPGCAEMCDNWAIHKSARDQDAAILPERSPSDSAPSPAVIAAVEIGSLTEPPIAFRIGNRRGTSGARLPAYALNNRYRL